MKKLILLFVGVTTISSYSQSKKIFNDYIDLKAELIEIKSGTETMCSEMKNEWKNDSIRNLAKTKYIDVMAKMDGVASSFGSIIMKPSTIKASRANIQKQLDGLAKSYAEMKAIYVSGLTYTTKGSNFDTGGITVVTQILDVATTLYDKIRKIIAGERKEISDAFKAECKLKTWKDL